MISKTFLILFGNKIEVIHFSILKGFLIEFYKKILVWSHFFGKLWTFPPTHHSDLFSKFGPVGILKVIMLRKDFQTLF